MQAHLDQKQVETPDVTTYIFKPEQPIRWRAGQFIRYTLPMEKSDDRGTQRFFTIASAPYQGFLQITTRLDRDHGSAFKAALDQLAIGDEVEVSEPMGEFVVEDGGPKTVLIAGGIGVTPYHSILLDLVHRQQPIPMTLLYANRDENIVFKSEFEQIASDHAEFETDYFIGDHHIELADIANAAGGPDQNTLIYISGPKPMVGSFKDQLLEAGYVAAQIKTDYFPGYN